MMIKRNKFKFVIAIVLVFVIKLIAKISGQEQYERVLAEFPPNEPTKSLIITHKQHYLFHTINIKCNTFNALNHLNNYGFVTEFYAQFELKFENCFKNTSSVNSANTNPTTTPYDNYKFNLNNLIKNFKIFLHWNQLVIRFDRPAAIDELTFFDNFNITHFNDKIHLVNANFRQNHFLKAINENLVHLNLENLGLLDLNGFVRNNITEIILANSTLLNFNRKNLKKFLRLKKLTIKNFGITANFSTKRKFFKLNKALVDLKLVNFVSDRRFSKIVLNNKLFYGLTNLEYLELKRLKLDRIPAKLFYGLDNLVDLSVADNRIETLDVNLFRYNEYLKRINLAGNNILLISGCDALIDQTILSTNVFGMGNAQLSNNATLEDSTNCSLEFSSHGITIYLDEKDSGKNVYLVERLLEIENIENIYLGHESLH